MKTTGFLFLQNQTEYGKLFSSIQKSTMAKKTIGNNET
jgi:hypothetical protein